MIPAIKTNNWNAEHHNYSKMLKKVFNSPGCLYVKLVLWHELMANHTNIHLYLQDKPSTALHSGQKKYKCALMPI